MKVELGGGANAMPGFVCVDMNPRHADVIADALSLPFRDASVTALRAVDILEHLSYRDTDRALAEWARVCAPNAAVYVQVPDAETIMHWFVHQDSRLLRTPPDIPKTYLAGATWRLLGGHLDGEYCDDGDDFRWNAHFAFFSTGSLTRHLNRAGFTVERMETNPHPNLLTWAVRT